jgi:hypothetical protein
MCRPVNFLAWALFALVALAAAQDDRSLLAERVQQLTRESPWRSTATIPIAFRTFHPQGLVKIGNRFYLSSVEVHDRQAGRGVGHLFKLTGAGALITDLRLGEGPIYHPGGIDYDGKDIWVPLAEYRPDSSSIIYRVNPETMTATRVLAFEDHIGAIVHDTASRALYGVSWGSRRFYRWTLDEQGRVTNAGVRPQSLQRLNPSHYIDYQDCKFVVRDRMLCTGVAVLQGPSLLSIFRLGGLELVDLKESRPVHQVPVSLWTNTGLDMTHNASWIEVSAAGLRAYFVPEDDRSRIYVYEVQIKEP